MLLSEEKILTILNFDQAIYFVNKFQYQKVQLTEAKNILEIIGNFMENSEILYSFKFPTFINYVQINLKRNLISVRLEIFRSDKLSELFQYLRC